VIVGNEATRAEADVKFKFERGARLRNERLSKISFDSPETLIAMSHSCSVSGSE
jgi:hypothetical protein